MPPSPRGHGPPRAGGARGPSRMTLTPPDLDDREAHASCIQPALHQNPSCSPAASTSILHDSRSCWCSCLDSNCCARLGGTALPATSGIRVLRTRLNGELSARWARYYDDGVLRPPDDSFNGQRLVWLLEELWTLASNYLFFID